MKVCVKGKMLSLKVMVRLNLHLSQFAKLGQIISSFFIDSNDCYFGVSGTINHKVYKRSDRVVVCFGFSLHYM